MRRALVVAAAALVLLTGVARAQPPVLGFTVSSGPGAGATTAVSLPSASVPNQPGAISVPVSFTSPPALTQRLDLGALHQLWQRAGAAYGIPWNVLAAINKIESNFGENMGPSSAGAVGWMQFMPSTWLRWGVDADGDGTADPWNATDAIFAAARYLAPAGGQTDISGAVFYYNHADWYVQEVLDLARVYGSGTVAQTRDLQRLQQALAKARKSVVAANRVLIAAQDHDRQLLALQLAAGEKAFGLRIGVGVEQLEGIAIARQKTLQAQHVGAVIGSHQRHGTLVGLQQVPATIDHHGRVRFLLRQHVVERSADRGKCLRIEPGLLPCRRITGGQHQLIRLTQRNVQCGGQAQHHLAAGLGPAEFEEADMALRAIGRHRQLQLRQCTFLPPPFEARREPGR